MKPLKIVLFDNYDSFTHNLYHLLATTFPNSQITVHRNHDRQLFHQSFDLIIGGPGPCTPGETGILKQLFETRIIAERIPFLGVCLGMQFIAWYFGIPFHRSSVPIHGDAIPIQHLGTSIFNNLPNNFPVARYNSLEIREKELKNTELITLATEEKTGAVMALKHKSLPLYGIQYHPESFLSKFGKEILLNFHNEVYQKND
ncbi:MAG TPA: aminodeoxychorismate/anthranilate synthase component II [Salinivirgaceae bacterium]|nr:aminodeoxychorismate/anthranilate synthase component II [Salinivirgaceae bacterium]